MRRSIWLFTLAACAAPSPSEQMPPPGEQQLVLDAPAYAFAGDAISLDVYSPLPDGTLLPGDSVGFGWGSLLVRSGRCPNRQLANGLCLQIGMPSGSARYLFSSTAFGSTEGMVSVDLAVPNTSLDRVHIQALSVAGTRSATTNPVSIDILRNPCDRNNGRCEDLCGVEVIVGDPYTAEAVCDCSTGTLNPDGRTCDTGPPTPACDGSTLPYESGSGTELDPYILCAPEQFASLETTPGFVRIDRDLDFTTGSISALPEQLVMAANTHLDGGGFALIGPALTSGIFDGVPETSSISNLDIELSGYPIVRGPTTFPDWFSGLLVDQLDGEVHDIHVTGDCGFVAQAGVVVGAVRETGYVHDVTVSGNFVAQQDAAWGNNRQMMGGIAGQNEGLIEDVRFVGSIHGGTAGGISARNDRSTIRRATVQGNVLGNMVGGLSGDVFGGLIEESSMVGNVTAEAQPGQAAQRAGGLVGYIRIEPTTIRRSFSRANVTSPDDSTGGLVGLATEGLIEDSYARGNVSRSGAGDSPCSINGGTAGLLGVNQIAAFTVTRSIASGDSVNAPNVDDGAAFVSAFCDFTLEGTFDGYYTFANGATDDAPGLVNVSGIQGLQSSYPTLDFATVWAIPTTDPTQTGPLMPVLQWQCGTEGIVCNPVP